MKKDIMRGRTIMMDKKRFFSNKSVLKFKQFWLIVKI